MFVVVSSVGGATGDCVGLYVGVRSMTLTPATVSETPSGRPCCVEARSLTTKAAKAAVELCNRSVVAAAPAAELPLVVIVCTTNETCTPLPSLLRPRPCTCPCPCASSPLPSPPRRRATAVTTGSLTRETSMPKMDAIARRREALTASLTSATLIPPPSVRPTVCVTTMAGALVGAGAVGCRDGNGDGTCEGLR